MRKKGVIQIVRSMGIQDDLWYPFVKKHKSASKRMRELIRMDLEESSK